MNLPERQTVIDAAVKIRETASKGDAHFQLMEEDARKLYNIWTAGNRDAAGILARWGIGHLDIGDAMRAFMHAEAVLVTETRDAVGEGQ